MKNAKSRVRESSNHSKKARSAGMEARQFHTRIDLPQEARHQMISLLNQELADVFDLYSQVKQAHWNVKGVQFYQLHELFDEMAEQLLAFADIIAERATALGGEARGTVRMAALASRLDEYPEDIFDSMKTVSSLADRYATLTASMREAIDTAEQVEDMDTSDLFIDVSRLLDKQLWFLEAHLQN